jgi:glycine dehydrogenase
VTDYTPAIDSTPAIEPDFISRHIGPDRDDVAAMLKVVGQPSLEAMLDTAMRHPPKKP